MKMIDGKTLLEALQSGSNAMSNNKERIDAMNVFPVPDGDTGSNMASTVEYAINDIKDLQDASVAEISSKYARGMLMGARGNSGVILSQIFKGFSVGLKDLKTASPLSLAEAFKKAEEYAYKSVMQPVEGTILTVIRMISEKLYSTITPNSTVIDLFKTAAEEAKKSCIKTPDFLPVLKEVGVTDSGGEGLLMIIEGMYKYLLGEPVVLSNKPSAVYNQEFIYSNESFNGEFGYCTEFILGIKSLNGFKKDKFTSALEKIGDSAVVVVDGDILKTHIHAKKPGQVLGFAQKFGEFLKIKIDNMTLQANESQKAKKGHQGNNTNEKINIGVISCNNGPGIIDDMRELGADFIIEAGQSQNPSAKNFIEAIESLNTDRIIILPNNSNIILVAQQVTQTTKKEVVVVPSKTQMQGLVAMMNFNREGSILEAQDIMKESLSDVKTGQVTKAARSTRIEGVSVKEGEFLAVLDNKILKSTQSKTGAAIEICKKAINEDSELVTIYYGSDSGKTDSEEVSSFIETNYDVEVEIKNGGQPTYNFLISFE